MRWSKWAAVFAASLSISVAEAADLFTVTLTVNGETGTQSFTRIEDAANSLDTSGLQQIVSSYTETSPATAAINLRGVPATGIFEANSPALRVVVPGAGIDITFQGATRDESRQLFEDWLKGQGSSQVNQVLRLAAATTPIDPVAGNPNAAMNQFVAADFGRSLEAAVGGSPSGVGLGARFGNFTAAGYSSRSISLPLNSTFQLSPNDTLELDVPLTWSDTEGGRSYAANFGILYRRRLFERWTLQPSFRFGAVGSRDLGGGSLLYSVALNSTLDFDLHWGGLRLTVANGLTFVSTLPTSIGKYSLNYDLQNFVFRNGIVLTRDLGFQILRRPVQGSIFFVDTRFTGDAVFISNYQEFGLFAQVGRDSPARLGFTYLTGAQGVRGFSLNTGVVF